MCGPFLSLWFVCFRREAYVGCWHHVWCTLRIVLVDRAKTLLRVLDTWCHATSGIHVEDYYILMCYIVARRVESFFSYATSMESWSASWCVALCRVVLVVNIDVYASLHLNVHPLPHATRQWEAPTLRTTLRVLYPRFCDSDDFRKTDILILFQILLGLHLHVHTLPRAAQALDSCSLFPK